MDIVKQRRKRLMVWILAIVLCVGMWQGSVYATEGEGDGKDPVITEGSDESIEPQSVEPQNTEPDPNVPVVTSEGGDGTQGETTTYNMKFVLTNTDNEDVSLNSTNFTGKNEFVEWRSGDSGHTYTAQYGAESLNISNIYFESYMGYKHNVLKWKYSPLPGKSGEITTGTINVKENIKPNTEAEGNYEEYVLTAILGKSVLVTFWESDASGNIKEDTSLGNSVSIAEGDTNLKVTLPNAGSTNGFATEWRVEGKAYSIGSEYAVDFSNINEFEKYIQIGAVLSTTISSPGKFYLCPETKYTLSSGKWKMDDGYTYNGDRTFFVSTKEGEYSFSQ